MKENKKPQRKHFKLKEFEVVLLSAGARIPQKSARGAIGYDVFVPKDVKVPAHSRTAIPLDIAINLPFGNEAKIEPRSGHSLHGMEGFGTKTEIVRRILGIFAVKKTRSGRLRFDADVLVGKVDPNYVDNIHVIIKNNDTEFTIRAGSRIAQMTFYQTTSPFFKVVDKLTCKSRGGGLGSTGTGIERLGHNQCNADDGNDKPLVLADDAEAPTISMSNLTDESSEVEEVDSAAIISVSQEQQQDIDEDDDYGVHV